MTPETATPTGAQPDGSTAAPATEPKKDVYVATLNIKSIGCDPRACFTNQTKVPVPGSNPPQSVPGGTNPTGLTSLCKIWGRAVSLKHGENKRDNSVWTALSGKFGALNIQTGQVYNSGKLFLPAGIQDIVESAVIEIQRSVDQGKIVEGDMNVQFALEIRSKVANNPIGYTYEAENLMPIETNTEPDPLRAFILEGKPMLPVAPPVAQLAAPESTQAAGQTERAARRR